MIRIRSYDQTAAVSFRYDEEALDIVRTLPGRKWVPEHKVWVIDVEDVRLAATRFHRAGFDVLIDGHKFTPKLTATRASSSDPLTALWAALPPELREPAYRALSKVLHPDAGGDEALMKALNRAAGR